VRSPVSFADAPWNGRIVLAQCGRDEDATGRCDRVNSRFERRRVLHVRWRAGFLLRKPRSGVLRDTQRAKLRHDARPGRGPCADRSKNMGVTDRGMEVRISVHLVLCVM